MDVETCFLFDETGTRFRANASDAEAVMAKKGWTRTPPESDPEPKTRTRRKPRTRKVDPDSVMADPEIEPEGAEGEG